MTTMNVLDSSGSVVAVEKPLAPGRFAAATSRPVVLSNEDLAAVNAITTALATNHSDEAQLHTDIATTIHGDLATLHTDIATTVHGDLTQLHTDLIAPTPAGTNLIGRAVADASAATGGIASAARLPSSAASTNATNVKASAGRVYCVEGKNTAAYDIFLVLYDVATTPAPGTTAIRKKMVCPAGQSFIRDYPLGLSFASGIGFAITKLVADGDTTSVAAGDMIALNVDYV